MKLYTKAFAPNGLRVTMLVEKKGIPLEIEYLERDGTRSERYHAINPLGRVPALELDDGRCLGESLTISHYLDAISGAPFLCGEGLDERIEIEMWERRAEFELLVPVVEYGHHVHPLFTGRLEQFPDWAASIAPQPQRFMTLLEARLADHAYVAGERFTIADITASIGARLATFYGLYPMVNPAIDAWLKRVDAFKVERP